MRFKIIYDVKDEDVLAAGRRLSDWTKSALSVLPEGKETIIVFKKYAPLVTVDYLTNLVRNLEEKFVKKAFSETFTLIMPKGTGAMRINDFVTKRVTPFTQTKIEKLLYRKIASYWIRKGVRILSVDGVYIDYGVRLEKGCTIYPFNSLKGRSVVKENAVLYYSNVITDSVIGKNSEIKASYIQDSVVGDDCTVGPFAYLRQNALIGNGVRVGDFVEIKNSRLGDGVKSAHLTYIGDAEVGENTNVGCGTVFANYDGKTKHKTTVGRNAFIGCNANLIAPLNIGDDCFIAGGSTVTDDVPSNTFAIARVKQTNKKKK